MEKAIVAGFNDYDKRQLSLMLEKINQFKDGVIYLPDLINDLNALVDILESTNDSRKEEFRGFWWDLEQVYAVFLYREEKVFDHEDKK